MSAAKQRRQEKHTCLICGTDFYARKGAKTCSRKCRKQLSLTGQDAWARFKAQIEAMGPDAARKRAAEDDDFRNYLMTACETLTELPRGQQRVGTEAEERIIAELSQSGQRGFSVVNHDTPLPSDADIEAAAESGDWSGMVDSALDGMTWQLGHGYKPDLREFGYEPVTAQRIAQSEAWVASMEREARQREAEIKRGQPASWDAA